MRDVKGRERGDGRGGLCFEVRSEALCITLSRMNSAPQPAPDPPAVLAALATSTVTRMLATTWWVLTGSMAALAYLSAITSDGVMAPLGGAVFLAGLTVVATVARNASAEAQRPGSVRRGSLLRAALLGVVVHGGLLSAVTLFSGSAFVAGLLVVAGGLLVAVTKPTTLVALGLDLENVQTVPQVPTLSTPQIIGELRATADEVRTTGDPARRTELAERRGELIAMLADRDPEALALLLDDSTVHPSRSDGPDGPVPA